MNWYKTHYLIPFIDNQKLYLLFPIPIHLICLYMAFISPSVYIFEPMLDNYF